MSNTKICLVQHLCTLSSKWMSCEYPLFHRLEHYSKIGRNMCLKKKHYKLWWTTNCCLRKFWARPLASWQTVRMCVWNFKLVSTRTPKSLAELTLGISCPFNNMLRCHHSGLQENWALHTLSHSYEDPKIMQYREVCWCSVIRLSNKKLNSVSWCSVIRI